LLAETLTSTGRYAEADKTLEELARLSPHPRIALSRYQVRQRGSMAPEYGPLEDWLAAHPDDVIVRATLAEALRVAGENARAIAEYEKVVTAAPKNVASLNNLAWLYLAAADARAAEMARRAWELAPKNGPVLDTYGWILVERGAVAEGLPLLEAAQRASGLAHPEIQLHLATALARAGERDRARSLLQALLAEFAEFPGRPSATKLLAELEGKASP
jgi:cellulose synthase operon protein C